MTRALGLVGLLVLSACAAGGMHPTGMPPCLSNDECSGTQICLADGCADPAKGMVVEVTGDMTAGQYSRDVEIPDGGLTPVLDFPLGPPLQMTGEFQRERSSSVDPTNREAYTSKVLVRANGQSDLLPSVARAYQSTFQPEGGVFSMFMGAGRFQVVAYPDDTSVPPAFISDFTVPSANGDHVTFVFPSVEGAVTLSGRLLKRRVSTVPPMDLAVTTVAMDLQAFDPVTLRPLSQRIPVSSGLPGSRGDFVLTMAAEARDLPLILLRATPRDTGAMVPTKSFTVSAPLPSAVTLELGDFGDALPRVSGQVLADDGTPVANATVVIEGAVGGGGTFRSRLATTDSSGGFALDLLANDPQTPFTVTVVPPPNLEWATVRTAIRVETKLGGTPTLTPSQIRCPSRVAVSGTVYRADSEDPAVGAKVIAVALGDDTSRSLALEDVEGVVDSAGRFNLWLDPGRWQIDLVPVDDTSARLGRIVTVAAPLGVPATTFDVGTLTLPRGRKVTGTVTSGAPNRGVNVVPYATLRFFRVTQVGGRPASVLLGQAVADGRGQYSVLLPVR